MIQNFTSNALLSGTYQIFSLPGLVLTVKTSTVPVLVSFDGNAYQPLAAGSVFDLRNAGGFKTFTIQNQSTNSTTATVNFWVGDVPVNFSPADNSTALAQTYAVGNLGIANGAAAAGPLPACNASGLLQIASNKTYAIANTDPATGHRRQIVTFSIDPNATFTLAVMDPNGNTMMILQKGSQIQLVTDAPLLIQGVSGTVGVSIGQIYLSNN